MSPADDSVEPVTLPPRPESARELIALLAQRSRKRRHSELLPSVLGVYLGYRVYWVDVKDKHFVAEIESRYLDDFLATIGGEPDRSQRYHSGLCGVKVRFEP